MDQFTAEFGPTQQDYNAVIDYFRANGITVVDTTPNRLNLQVTGSAANVQSAFHVNLGVYQHPTENRTFYAPDSEPTTGLAISLWHVDGLDNFSIPRPAGLTHNPDRLKFQVRRHHRLRPLGLVPGQRHACGLLFRAAEH